MEKQNKIDFGYENSKQELKKKKWIDIAEIVDAFRLIPRLVLLAYGYLVYITVIWFMTIDGPSTQQVTLVSTIVGAAAIVIGLYNNSGRKW